VCVCVRVWTHFPGNANILKFCVRFVTLPTTHTHTHTHTRTHTTHAHTRHTHAQPMAHPHTKHTALHVSIILSLTCFFISSCVCLSILCVPFVCACVYVPCVYVCVTQYTDGIAAALDPNSQLIHHRLGKEYTVYRDGKHVKVCRRACTNIQYTYTHTHTHICAQHTVHAVHTQTRMDAYHSYMHTHTRACVCVCVCVCAGSRPPQPASWAHLNHR